MTCNHRHIGWPRKKAQRASWTVQCHDCFRRLLYDWDKMKIIGVDPEDRALKLPSSKLGDRRKE